MRVQPCACGVVVGVAIVVIVIVIIIVTIAVVVHRMALPATGLTFKTPEEFFLNAKEVVLHPFDQLEITPVPRLTVAASVLSVHSASTAIGAPPCSA